jgi:hypothetical protein
MYLPESVDREPYAGDVGRSECGRGWAARSMTHWMMSLRRIMACRFSWPGALAGLGLPVATFNAALGPVIWSEGQEPMLPLHLWSRGHVETMY